MRGEILSSWAMTARTGQSRSATSSLGLADSLRPNSSASTVQR